MKRQAKRPTSPTKRASFVTARISDQARHFLEVLSLMHRESLSSVIETAIGELADLPEDRFGAWKEGPWDAAGGHATGTNVARATWAQEEWLRHLKIAAISPDLLTPAENTFWRNVIRDRSAFWLADDPASLSKEARARLGQPVLNLGVPKEPDVAKAWDSFREQARPKEDGGQSRAPSNLRGTEGVAASREPA